MAWAVWAGAVTILVLIAVLRAVSREWGRRADMVDHLDREAVEAKAVRGYRRGLFLLGLGGRHGDLLELVLILR